MDVLSHVLRDLRLSGVVLSVGEYRAPWGIEKPRLDGAPFHLIIEGHCWLRTDEGEVVELSPGDLILFPHGNTHTLMSDRKVVGTPFSKVLVENGISPDWQPDKRVGGLHRIRFGGDGPLTRLVNGVFSFGVQWRNPLLQALPSIIHARRSDCKQPLLSKILAELLDVADAAEPGFQLVADRLADVAFIQLVRDHICHTQPRSGSWLFALSDRQIAMALSLIHARPGQPWTIASLASEVSLSRTVFAVRFRSLVGDSVMEYVTRQRMHVAARLLCESSRSLAMIANDVGYESDISFSRAFRRWAGIPPGRFRRDRHGQVDVHAKAGSDDR